MIKITFTAVLLFYLTSLQAQLKKLPEIGIAQSLENDSLVNAIGYRYLVESVSKVFFSKEASDEQFNDRMQIIKKLKTKLYAVNVFIPGSIKLVGPEVNMTTILTHVEIVFQRAS